MKRPLWIALLAAIAFLAIVLVRMPAAWLLPSRGGQWSCASIEGSLWSGGCAALTVSSTSLGDLSWDLHPSRLLLGRAAAHLTLSHGPAEAAADVEATFGGRVTARNVVADLPLDSAIVPAVPANLHGRAHCELALVELQRGVLRQLQGRIEARNLEERSGNNTALQLHERELTMRAPVQISPARQARWRNRAEGRRPRCAPSLVRRKLPRHRPQPRRARDSV